MANREWVTLRRHPLLDIEWAHLFFINSSFSYHMHDYYVLGLIDYGLQSFKHRHSKHITPPGGLILLNPGEAHTGEAAERTGFQYRAIYPTVAGMDKLVYELTGKHRPLPDFRHVRADDALLAKQFHRTHSLLMTDNASPLLVETALVLLLNGFIQRYANIDCSDHPAGGEKRAVTVAKDYIDSHWAEKIGLDKLASLACLSRYHFVREFSVLMGMPPHVYQESIRLSRARNLLRQGISSQEVAYLAGFSDQSHFTNRYKRMYGIPPGMYIREIKGGLS